MAVPFPWLPAAGASGGFEASFPAELSGQIDDLFARPVDINGNLTTMTVTGNIRLEKGTVEAPR